ncbi:MAG: hypothetical protein HQL15_07860, partial [Candidatus Omnitrophica bacterium]|nr:hypothetical protein [Candidatus Omnitrophota bacterium]
LDAIEERLAHEKQLKDKEDQEIKIRQEKQVELAKDNQASKKGSESVEYSNRQDKQKQEDSLDKKKYQEGIRKETKRLRIETETDYITAVDFFNEKKYKEAKNKFETVEERIHNYKSTNSYLRKVNKLLNIAEIEENQKNKRLLEEQIRLKAEDDKIKEAHKKWIETQKNGNVDTTKSNVIKPPIGNEIKSVTSIPDQKEKQEEQEARLLSDLADKSSKLYREISNISDDKNTIPAKAKLAKVDTILNNLKREQENTLKRVREEEERHHQKELKNKETLRTEEAQRDYENAMDFLKAKKFDEAKRMFLEIESIKPNFKNVRRYLINIDADQRKVQEEAIAEKVLEEQKKWQEQQSQKRIVENQERKKRIAKKQEQLSDIAQKANGINDEILKLTKERNYLKAKEKFDELESTMIELKKMKDSIEADKDDAKLALSQDIEHGKTNREIQEVLREKRLQNKQNNNISIIKERQKLDDQGVAQFRNNEVKKQNEVILNQAIELYNAKKINEAKIIFEELASKGDQRAKVYLKRINKNKNQNGIYRLKESVEHERSDYLAERLHRQKIEKEIEAREAEHQKKLYKDLERQKKQLFEQQQEEKRRIETLKLQENQRRVLEKNKRAVELRSQKEDKEYHFRKIQPVSTKTENLSSVVTESTTQTNNFTKVKVPSAENKMVEPVKTISEIQNIEPAKKKENVSENIQKKRDADKAIKEQEKKDIAVKEQQKKLEEEHTAIRQQLESGVNSMYKEAVKLYNSGNYQAAAKRFSDVQDLIPNYKHTAIYIEKIQKQINKFLVKSTPSVLVTPIKSIEPPAITTDPLDKTTKVSRQDQIAKTLDLFDSK